MRRLAVGSTVALLGLFASPISGASMNPARTLGPDIVSWDFTGWWIYIVGPLVGAAIAVMIIGAGAGPAGRPSARRPKAARCPTLEGRPGRELRRPGRQRAGTMGRSPGAAASPAASMAVCALAPSSEIRRSSAMRT